MEQKGNEGWYKNNDKKELGNEQQYKHRLTIMIIIIVIKRKDKEK